MSYHSSYRAIISGLIVICFLAFSWYNFIPGPDFINAQTSPQDYDLGPRPQVFVPVFDPIGGATITRITDNDGSSTNIRHNYSSAQIFNADGTVIYMSKGRKFLDATTYANLPYDFINSNNAPIWSTINPKEMIIAKDSTVYRWDVTSKKEN